MLLLHQTILHCTIVHYTILHTHYYYTPQCTRLFDCLTHQILKVLYTVVYFTFLHYTKCRTEHYDRAQYILPCYPVLVLYSTTLKRQFPLESSALLLLQYLTETPYDALHQGRRRTNACLPAPTACDDKAWAPLTPFFQHRVMAPLLLLSRPWRSVGEWRVRGLTRSAAACLVKQRPSLMWNDTAGSRYLAWV